MKSKVKILKSKRLTTCCSPIYFEISLKTNNETFKGKLIIDRKKKTIRVNLGKPLNNDEKLVFLKEIFYCFCITECRYSKNYTTEHIEEYIFIDENIKQNPRLSIIESIMQYDKSDFDQYNKKEKILSHIKFSYNKIVEANNMKLTFLELDPIFDYSKKEIEVYKKILIKYLKSNGFRGVLEAKKVMYNDNETFGYYPYCYNYSFYMITYEILDFMR